MKSPSLRGGGETQDDVLRPVIFSTSPTIRHFARPARPRVRCEHSPANGIISPTNWSSRAPNEFDFILACHLGATDLE